MWQALVTAAILVLPRGSAGDSSAGGHARLAAATQVMNSIVAVAGDRRTPPTLRIVPGGSGVRVAWYSPKEHAVILEEQSVDLCFSMGADSLNALAVMIGHELAHVYRDHDFPGDFGNGFAELSAAGKVRAASASWTFLYEVQADVFGGLFGHLAGYNTLGVTPRLLPMIYQHFQLDEAEGNYPSLFDRQQIAVESEQRLAKLVPVFDVGRHLLAIGENELSAAFFAFLARDFPSRDIQNNAGVALAREALKRMTGPRSLLALPLDLDPETRLRPRRAGTRSVATADPVVDSLLTAAHKWLTQAEESDPRYAVGLINLACVEFLRGADLEARAAARRALLVTDDMTIVAAAHIVEGACLLADDPAAARAAFVEARLGRPDLARTNLNLLDGALPPPTPDRARIREAPIGTGTEIHAAILADPISIELTGMYPGAIPPWLLYREFDDRIGYIVDSGSYLVFLIATKPSNTGETGGGIRLGASRQDVEAAYGLPDARISAVGSSQWVYQDARLAIELDSDGSVAGWLQYSHEGEFYQSPDTQPYPFGPRVALVIGNDDYSAGRLKNAVGDAVAMGQVLQRAGFRVIQSTNANYATMTDKIREFGETLRAQGGAGLFYYAGHGLQIEGANYLIPLDAQVSHRDDIEREFMPLARVERYLAEANNELNVMIIDACRNDPYTSTAFRSAGVGLADVDVRGTFVAFATETGKVAVDAGIDGHSAFTGSLLQHLLTPGLPIEHLFYEVRKDVERITGGMQTPLTRSKLTGPFYFVPEGKSAIALEVGSIGMTPPLPFPTERSDTVRVETADGVFYLDRFEVTVGAFADFLSLAGNRMEDGSPWFDSADVHAPISGGPEFLPKPGLENHPVTEISWYGARAYCRWQGKRLPSSDEWLASALGPAGARFPWADESAGTAVIRANFEGDQDSYQTTAPVGSFPAGASPYGAQDMAGNVWEWIADEQGTMRLALGASWHNDASWFSQRQWLDASIPNEVTGFRCVQSTR
jgi:formylglycine-generating enzyme required for sulfatase activity